MTDAPRTAETAFNGYFAEVLRGKHPAWRDGLGVEQTGAFPDAPGLRPDILVRPADAQPVAIETEYAPADTVEADARARLGLTPAGCAEPIEQAVAVRVPDSLRRGQEALAARIAAARFEYCVVSGGPAAAGRWPASGWLDGGIDDIARCVEHAMVSDRLVEEATTILETDVAIATRAVQDAHDLGFTDIVPHIGRILRQTPGEQTNRMAMTIVANALTFHAAIGGARGIPPFSLEDSWRREALRDRFLRAWAYILREINYWPIFKVAGDLLSALRPDTADRALLSLGRAADRLAKLGVNSRHDLSGRMFQKLIADRKFLATFYTLPNSAALLAELAVARLDADWSDLGSYPGLRIADLSCGTGTLLSAAYRAVLGRYRRAGGDDREIHRAMIERSLVAADIMPAAAHLCASQLSSVHPSEVFSNTRVYTMPYGTGAAEERERGVSIGSLDLIAAERTGSLFPTGQRRIGGDADDADVQDIELPHGSVDLAIMNPPFTRPTNHEIAGAPVPSFAGFQTSADEQRAMSDSLARIRGGLERPAGHGNAGLASNFVDLAHAKVRPGGVVALVLPIAAIAGEAWRPARDLLSRRYDDITVVTIATSGEHDRAFSADTGMAEALVVATKRREGNGAPGDALFLNLLRRPRSIQEAAEVARIAGGLPEVRAGRFAAAGQVLGTFVRAPLAEGGCVALRESALASAMMALRGGELRMPRYASPLAVPVAPLGELGERGLVDRDIGGRSDALSSFRGPFRIVSILGVPSYPVLWAHDARRERRLVVEPDSEGEVRPGHDDRAVAVWRTATRLHFNRDFQINSQSLAACMTPEPAIGGRAWPNFRMRGEGWDKAVALWANSTPGLMAFWWEGSRQQQGRAVLTIATLPGLTVLDPRALPADALRRAGELFDAFAGRTLLPANEAWRDETRQALDRAVLVDLLGLPEDALEAFANLRLQWCAEPSVHGGKPTAPPAGGGRP